MIAAITSDQIWAFRFLFSIFALLVLPFASLFLSAKLRRRLGIQKVIWSLVVLIVVIPAGLALVTPALLKSPYLRFVEKDQKYYSQVARACDAILAQHPLGTNEFIGMPGSDSSVPGIIRDLHPSAITISSNRVHVMVGVREFGMSWEAQDGDTNSWTLNVYAEGPERVLYVEKR